LLAGSEHIVAYPATLDTVIDDDLPTVINLETSTSRDSRPAKETRWNNQYPDARG